MRMMTWNLMAAGAAIAALAFARVAGFPPRAVGAAESKSGVSCPTGEGIQGVARAAGADTAAQPEGVDLELPPIDAKRPERTETATFALGWFWGVDSRFGSIEGVLQTVVGYTGGEKENPTYRRMGDHTESVQVVFDPQRVQYEELLEVFWSSHDPRSNSWSRQYRNAIFYHGEEQRRSASSTRNQLARDLQAEVQTVVEAAGTFYPAEDYHQKYMLRAHPDLYRELRAPYPTDERLVASTAAARVNGYLGGYGSSEQLDTEIDRLSLSADGQARLRAAVRKR